LLLWQVDGIVWSVAGAGGVVGADLLAPRGHRLGRPVQFGHSRRPALVQEVVEEAGSLSWAGGGVAVTEGLLGHPGVEHGVVRVAGGEAGFKTRSSLVAQR